jgi:hypothetical protein
MDSHLFQSSIPRETQALSAWLPSAGSSRLVKTAQLVTNQMSPVRDPRSSRSSEGAVFSPVEPPAEDFRFLSRSSGLHRASAALHCTCVGSLFAVGADQDYLAAHGHQDVITTTAATGTCCSVGGGEIGQRRQLAMHAFAADVAGLGGSRPAPTSAERPADSPPTTRTVPLSVLILVPSATPDSTHTVDS